MYIKQYECLVLLQVAKCFVPVQIFCVGPKIYLHIVPVTNILCQNKKWFAFSKIGFCAGTKVFEEALNAVKFLGWLKKFGPAQNILGPVKGQGISKPRKRKIFQIICASQKFWTLCDLLAKLSKFTKWQLSSLKLTKFSIWTILKAK